MDPPAGAQDAESPGNWRRHNIKPFTGGMQPPDYTEVPALMTDWVTEINAVRDELEPAAIRRPKPHVLGVIIEPMAEVVGRLHAGFERIHPFLDGNGRTGRLVTNLLLVRLGYPPAIIYKRERPRYLAALNKADHGDVSPLGELFARAILDNLMRFILPAVAGPAKLVPLEALATADLSVIALRNAAERGRLRAVRTRAGTWQSSKQWVNAYKVGRYKTLKEPRPERRRGGPARGS